jgi:hypothetical protein
LFGVCRRLGPSLTQWRQPEASQLSMYGHLSLLMLDLMLDLLANYKMQIPVFLDQELRGAYRQQLLRGDPNANMQLDELVRQIQAKLTPGFLAYIGVDTGTFPNNTVFLTQPEIKRVIVEERRLSTAAATTISAAARRTLAMRVARAARGQRVTAPLPLPLDPPVPLPLPLPLPLDPPVPRSRANAIGPLLRRMLDSPLVPTTRAQTPPARPRPTPVPTKRAQTPVARPRPQTATEANRIAKATRLAKNTKKTTQAKEGGSSSTPP